MKKLTPAQRTQLNYLLKQDDFISYKDIADHFKLSIETVRSRMFRILEAGYTMEFITELQGNNSIGKKFKYAGETGKGFVCVDKEKQPCSNDDILAEYPRLRSNTVIEFCDALLELNPKGYWTFNDVTELTGLSKSKIRSAFSTTKKSSQFVYDYKGCQHNREFRLLSIGGKPQPVEVDIVKETKRFNLLNSVFA